jgi:hypothetical protein
MVQRASSDFKQWYLCYEEKRPRLLQLIAQRNLVSVGCDYVEWSRDTRGKQEATLCHARAVVRMTIRTEYTVLKSWAYCDHHGGVAKVEMEAVGFLARVGAGAISSARMRRIQQRLRKSKWGEEDVDT